MVAAAIEHSQLHRRMALSILKLCGTNPRFLMLGRCENLATKLRKRYMGNQRKIFTCSNDFSLGF